MFAAIVPEVRLFLEGPSCEGMLSTSSCRRFGADFVVREFGLFDVDGTLELPVENIAAREEAFLCCDFDVEAAFSSRFGVVVDAVAALSEQLLSKCTLMASSDTSLEQTGLAVLMKD